LQATGAPGLVSTNFELERLLSLLLNLISRVCQKTVHSLGAR
jgi:hypothetical protein